MVEPLSAAAVVGVVNEAFKFATAGLETYKARVEANANERDRQAQAAESERRRSEDRQFAREQYVQARADKRSDDRRALEAAKELARDATQLQNYPFRSGPGTLRNNIGLLSMSSQSMPLVVLFATPHREQ